MHHPSVTARGAAARRWLGPLPSCCQGWTPCLPAGRCLHAAVGGSSGPAALGAAPRKRGYPAARTALRPSLRSVLHLGLRPRRWTRRPPSLRDGLPLRGSGSRVAALRLAPGAAPPDPYRAAGAALRSHDAVPCGQPFGPASPPLFGATVSAPPSTRPWAGWGCGRLPLPPLRGSPATTLKSQVDCEASSAVTIAASSMLTCNAEYAALISGLVAFGWTPKSRKP